MNFTNIEFKNIINKYIIEKNKLYNHHLYQYYQDEINEIKETKKIIKYLLSKNKNSYHLIKRYEIENSLQNKFIKKINNNEEIYQSFTYLLSIKEEFINYINHENFDFNYIDEYDNNILIYLLNDSDCIYYEEFINIEIIYKKVDLSYINKKINKSLLNSKYSHLIYRNIPYDIYINLINNNPLFLCDFLKDDCEYNYYQIIHFVFFSLSICVKEKIQIVFDITDSENHTLFYYILKYCIGENFVYGMKEFSFCNMFIKKYIHHITFLQGDVDFIINKIIHLEDNTIYLFFKKHKITIDYFLERIYLFYRLLKNEKYKTVYYLVKDNEYKINWKYKTDNYFINYLIANYYCYHIIKKIINNDNSLLLIIEKNKTVMDYAISKINVSNEGFKKNTYHYKIINTYKIISFLYCKILDLEILNDLSILKSVIKNIIKIKYIELLEKIISDFNYVFDKNEIDLCIQYSLYDFLNKNFHENKYIHDTIHEKEKKKTELFLRVQKKIYS